MSEDITISTGGAPSLSVEGVPDQQMIPLGTEVTIGREPGCSLVIADTQASRKHARVFQQAADYLVEDLQSRNGTMVNGARISMPVRLRDGDVILIGRTAIRFAGGSGVAPPPTLVPPVADGHAILRTLVADQSGLLGEAESPEALKLAWPRLQALYAVLEAVSSLEDEREVGHVVLKSLFRLINAERGAILLQDPNGTLSTLCAMLRDGTADTNVKISKTLMGYVVKNRVALVTSDAMNDPRLGSGGEAASVYMLQISSAVSVPLIVKGKVLGVLQLLFEIPGQLVPEEDVRLMTVIAHQTAVAIESARLHQERKRMIRDLLATQRELQTRVEHLRILNEIERSLAQNDHMYTVLRKHVGEAGKLLHASGGALLLTTGPGEPYTVAHAAGDQQLAVALQDTQLGRNLVDLVLTTGKAQRIDPAEETGGGGVEITDERFRSVIAVPLTAVEAGKETRPGVLELFNKTDIAFSATDADLLAFVAAQMATAMRRKQLLVDKAKAERFSSLGAVAGSIMHDIRNPLMRIRGFAELSARPTVTPEARAKYAKNITAAVDRCANMASEILRFVKGETSLTVAEVSAAEFFDDVLLLLENDIQNAKLNLAKSMQYQGPLNIDADKMNRVIFNLSNNAIRVMKEGDTLSLSCRQMGDEIEIRVADTGPGIPDELRGRLFQPFATFGDHEGTGLGLSIVKSIVESHGGRIFLDESVPKGACFVILLKAPAA